MKRPKPVLSTIFDVSEAVAHYSVGSVVLLAQLVTLSVRMRKETFAAS